MKNTHSNSEKTPAIAKNKKMILIVIACVVVVAAALTITFAITHSSQNQKDAATADEPAETTAATAATSAYSFDDVSTYSIPLGFMELQYPERWKDAVTVDGVADHKASDSFTLTFAKGSDKLFDLIFNGSEGDSWGTVNTESGAASLNIKTYAIKTNDDTLYQMQEDLNVILNRIEKDYGNAESDASNGDSAAVFAVDAGWATLYYPKKWESKVTVDVQKNKVSFLQGKTPLFDIGYDTGEGTQIGSLNGKPVTVTDYKTTTDEQMEMKEDVNVILNHLRENAAFTE